MAVAAPAAAPHSGEDVKGDGSTASPAPRGSRFLGRRGIIALGVPVGLALLGVGLWSGGFLRGLVGPAGAKTADAPPMLFAMPELIANLASGAHGDHYVKADIRLVVSGRAALTEVRTHEPELQDMFLTYLRAMRRGELERPTSTWRLRQGLLDRAAVILGPHRVTNILFTNLLVQ